MQGFCGMTFGERRIEVRRLLSTVDTLVFFALQGLVISTIFTTEINAHQVTMAIFYPVLLLSGQQRESSPFVGMREECLILGIVWPLEGQPRWMRIVTTWLPMTKAIEALRGVLLKGKTD